MIINTMLAVYGWAFSCSTNGWSTIRATKLIPVARRLVAIPVHVSKDSVHGYRTLLFTYRDFIHLMMDGYS